MRIGIDIDNVISNFDEELLNGFLKHDKELRNTGIINKEKYMTKGMFDWSQEEIDDFYNNNIERIAKNLNVLEKAPEYIKKLKEKGFEIYIITGRNNGDYKNPYEITIEWLQKHNIVYDKLIFTNLYNTMEKARICSENNITIMIDDSIKNCLEINNTQTKVLFMDTLFNREESSLTRVYNWKEIYEYIINYKEKN